MKTFCLAVLAWLTLASANAQTLEIPGSGPPTRLLQVLASAFNERHASAHIKVPESTGMSGALDAVRNKDFPLARLGRRLSADEEKSGLRQTVIAREAIVFATGADVTVSSVSPRQLVAIFSGALTNWRELGGEPGPIRVLYRENTEGLLRIIRTQMPEFTTFTFTTNGRLLNRDYEVVEMLERFGWAVGWGAVGNVHAAPGLRALALDDVVPGTETLRSGHYPLYYEAVLIYKSKYMKGIARQFLDFVTSPDGRKVIETFGALPLPKE